MLGKSAICLPNLGLVERQFSSLVATLGNFFHNDIQMDAEIRSTYRVGDGDCKTNDGEGKILFQPVFPAS